MMINFVMCSHVFVFRFYYIIILCPGLFSIAYGGFSTH